MNNATVLENGPATLDDVIPINRPTISLTQKGTDLLALLACRDRMAADDPLSAVVDRRISRLVDSDD